jgi:hypothetical protein
MSALPPKADIAASGADVRLVPKADMAVELLDHSETVRKTGRSDGLLPSRRLPVVSKL